jgi:ubiquitin C-terminal hydrolase
MQSVLQCLSNTPELVSFFAQHQLHLNLLPNKKDKAASRDNMMAINFGKFLRMMHYTERNSKQKRVYMDYFTTNAREFAETFW